MVALFHFGAFSQLQNPREVPYQWTKTDTTKLNVDLSEIMVVLPRNAFPSINYPGFITIEEGLKSFYKHEPVISIEINGEAKAFRELLLSIQSKTMEEQRLLIDEAFENWKRNEEQVDDVCVFGAKT